MVAWILAVAAVVPTGMSFVLGPLGMACGLVAHLKGRRAGFAAAVAAAIATVVGLSVQVVPRPVLTRDRDQHLGRAGQPTTPAAQGDGRPGPNGVSW